MDGLGADEQRRRNIDNGSTLCQQREYLILTTGNNESGFALLLILASIN